MKSHDEIKDISDFLREVAYCAPDDDPMREKMIDVSYFLDNMRWQLRKEFAPGEVKPKNLV